MSKSPPQQSSVPEEMSVPVAMPPGPRKEPKQARSIALVAALKQAGRQLLEDGGRDALTASRLADVSGVAISSIYEYFPAMDSLIAAIFEDYRTEVSQELLNEIMALPAHATLFDGIVMVLRFGLAVHHRKACLDPEFSQRSTRYDELVRLDLVEARQSWSAGATPALFNRFADEIHVTDRETAHFLVYQTLLTLPRAVALAHPEYLAKPGTAVLIARMVHAVLTEASPSQTQTPR
ncbi:MAG: TetR family transcriptional regulator [Pseudomonas sp.]|uniref:TetR/AcrR family transcriptional regulator n=1 Tax=Pseudomonas sp. TaxID=306 RepID=UPI000CB3DBFA|nr:TetR/AcrR family transcriptional regulator [Pseudomonas sp.]PJI47301.1 MAG: TetR family transcriptional regulator [Pseudomonas sp.]